LRAEAFRGFQVVQRLYYALDPSSGLSRETVENGHEAFFHHMLTMKPDGDLSVSLGVV